MKDINTSNSDIGFHLPLIIGTAATFPAAIKTCGFSVMKIPSTRGSQANAARDCVFIRLGPPSKYTATYPVPKLSWRGIHRRGKVSVRDCPQAFQFVRGSAASSFRCNRIEVGLPVGDISYWKWRSRLHERATKEAFVVALIRHHVKPN